MGVYWELLMGPVIAPAGREENLSAVEKFDSSLEGGEARLQPLRSRLRLRTFSVNNELREALRGAFQCRHAVRLAALLA